MPCCDLAQSHPQQTINRRPIINQDRPDNPKLQSSITPIAKQIATGTAGAAKYRSSSDRCVSNCGRESSVAGKLLFGMWHVTEREHFQSRWSTAENDRSHGNNGGSALRNKRRNVVANGFRTVRKRKRHGRRRWFPNSDKCRGSSAFHFQYFR